MDENKFKELLKIQGSLNDNRQYNKLIFDMQEIRKYREMQEDINKIVNAEILKIVNSPLVQNMREGMAQLNESFNAINLQFENSVLIRSIVELRASIDRIARHLHSQYYNTAKIYSELLQGSTLAGSIREISRNMKAIVDSPVFLELSDQLKRYIENEQGSLRYSQTFSGRVFNHLHEIYQAENQQVADAHAIAIQELFDSQRQSSSSTIISREGLIQILLTLILFIWQMHCSQKTDLNIDKLDQRTELILKTQNNILQTLIERSTIDSNEVCYIVLRRPAQLKFQPKSTSSTIKTLYPNQIVLLVETKGKWLYIEYFDYRNAVPKRGWVLKKYLKRIRKSNY